MTTPTQGEHAQTEAYFEEQPDGTIIPVDPSEMEAAPQGVAYAELPESSVKDGSAYVAGTIFTVEDMRDFADRTHALRASNGQAPACKGSAGECTFNGACMYACERSTSPLSDFQDGQWWIQELNKIWGAHARKIAVTDDLKRAVAVVNHLLRAVRETEAAATTPAAQADSQPAPVRDYPPLPEPDLGMPWRVNAKSDGAVHSSGFTCEQMRAYVDADRAARAPADSVTAPAATVIKKGADRQWMSERLGHLPDGIYSLYLAPPTQAADSVLEDAARLDWLLGKGRGMAIDSFGGQYRVVDTSCSLVVTDWMPTPRAAIDAARNQGASHD